MSDKQPLQIPAISGLKILAVFAIFVWYTGLISYPDLGGSMCEIFFACSGVLEALHHHGSYKYSLRETLGSFRRKLVSAYPIYLATFFVACIVGQLGYQNWTVGGNTYAAALNVLMLHPWFSNLQFSFNGVSWFMRLSSASLPRPCPMNVCSPAGCRSWRPLPLPGCGRDAYSPG